jgi:O-methyltransferase
MIWHKLAKELSRPFRRRQRPHARQLLQPRWPIRPEAQPRPAATWPPDFLPHEIEIIKTVSPCTMTSPERILAVIRALEHLERVGIEGDVVECGVWKGGSSMAAALTLLRLGSTQRTLHLFDTFEGMPPPDDVDRDCYEVTAAQQLDVEDQVTSVIWARAQLDEVQQNMSAIGYPAENVRFVRGRVEDTLPSEAPNRIALLRLDTDWYESTRHELAHLYPRLAPGGVLIIDDYGHWQGARRAVDEFIAASEPTLFLSRIDYTGRITVKPG